MSLGSSIPTTDIPLAFPTATPWLAGVGDLTHGDEAALWASHSHLALPLQPTTWHGIDPARPVTAAEIPTIQAAYAMWIEKNVARHRSSPSPQTLRAYLGDSVQFLQWLEQQTVGPVPEWCASSETLHALWTRLHTQGRRGIPLLLVTPQVAQDYIGFLMAPGHNGNGGSNDPRAADGRYSPATLAKKRSVLNTFFTFTQKNRLTLGNPLEGVDDPLRVSQNTRQVVAKPQTLTRAQAERLLSAVMNAYIITENPERKAQAIRDQVMIELMLLHGLRNIEIHRLNVDDYVPRARGEQATLTVTGRGDKARTIFLRPEMQSELDLWLNTRALFRFDTPALFVNLHGGDGQYNSGERLSQRSIRERVDVYLEKAGLKQEGVSCQTLRHTYATLYVQAKGKAANRAVLAASLGHSDPKSTDVYFDWIHAVAENPSEPLMEIHTAAQCQVETASCTATKTGANQRKARN